MWKVKRARRAGGEVAWSLVGDPGLPGFENLEERGAETETGARGVGEAQTVGAGEPADAQFGTALAEVDEGSPAAGLDLGVVVVGRGLRPEWRWPRGAGPA
jgi:hypothetical protein